MTWIYLTSDADCESLLSRFGAFHDGCLREIHVKTGHYIAPNLSMKVSGELDFEAEMLFQRQWKDPSAIELRFSEITELNIRPRPENYDEIIFEASLCFADNLFNFDADGLVTVSSRKLAWRDASSWMGPELRYRQPQ